MLSAEGLGEGFPPTPSEVTKWIEKQFKRKRAKRRYDQIEDRLTQMIDHLRAAQARIDEYAGFAQQVQRLCATEATDSDAAHIVPKVRTIIRGLERHTDLGRKTTETPKVAQQLAAKILALARTKGQLAECQEIGKRLRVIGAAQDRALSRCRTAARWLRQQCRMAVDSRDGETFAKRVQDLAERMLRWQ